MNDGERQLMSEVAVMREELAEMRTTLGHLCKMFEQAQEGGFLRCSRHSGRFDTLSEQVASLHRRLDGYQKYGVMGIVAFLGMLGKIVWDIIIKHIQQGG